LTANEETQQRRTVAPAGYRIHPGANPSNFNNDVAILIVPTALTFNQFVQPIILAASTAGTFAGDLATVSGWGRTSDGSIANSAQLRSVQNNVVTNAACMIAYGSSILDSTLCITTAGARGTCGGDNGEFAFSSNQKDLQNI